MIMRTVIITEIFQYLELFMKRLLSLVLLSMTAFSVMAADEFTLTIKDHAFTPKELVVPAGKKITLFVVNNDATPAEFESKSLRREKVISGNSRVTIKFGPLKPGRYAFVEEYHENEPAAQGEIIAK